MLSFGFNQINKFIWQRGKMNRARPYVNRFVKMKEQEIQDSYHSTNLKEMKPINTKLMEHSQTIIINHGKREMIKQVREIQIERENKLLLQKIASVMGKKGAYSVAKTKNIRTKVSKSLNEIYRKRQLQNIEMENKRFLQRLQNKRPTLNIQKMNKEWVQNKTTIKRMANVDFYLTNIKSSRMRSITSQRFSKSKYQKMRLMKTKVVDGEKMLIKIEFVGDQLKIIADPQNKKDIKIIEIPKEEAILFIEKNCQGKFQLLLEKLKYDAQSQTLYLISEHLEEEDVDFSEFNPEMDKIINKTQSNIKRVMEEQRKNKSAIHKTKTKTNHSIKQQSKQSIEPEMEKSKPTTHVQEKSVEKLSQSKRQIQIPSQTHIPLVKDLPTESNPNVSKEKKQVQKQNHKEDKIEVKKDDVEVEQQHIEVKQVKIQPQEQKYEEQQFFEQSHQKEKEQTPAVHKEKEIVVQPESAEDYNQQFQASGQVQHPAVQNVQG